MAQFIQANQLSPIQGSAGQQTVVQDNGPTFGEGLQSTISNVGGLIDTAGNIYGSNRAQSILNEELENIDTARAAAETGQFTAGDAVPENIKMDQKEWDMLATAVQTGSMSREKARLLASSRLRTRIAEEPLFADRMRKAASGLVGFNIESEGARQYFASFPTQGQLGGGGNEVLKAYREQAEADVALGLYDSVEAGMQFYAKADRLERDNKVAELQASAGIRNANDMANTLITNHNSVAWGGLIGNVKAEFNNTGSVKPEDFTRILGTQKQVFKERFDKSWVESGGDLNSEEYNRHLSRIDSEYDQMGEFVNEYGVDNIMKLKIERQEQLFDMLGMEMFPQLTLVTRTFGQQVTSDLINLSAMNPSKRDLLMKQNPELAAAFNLLNRDPKEFTKKIMGISTKILNGEDFDAQDAGLVDWTASQMHKNGSQETKAGTIRGLYDSNKHYKALSLLADSRAYLEPEENKKTFKTMFEQGLPAAISTLAAEVEAMPGINVEVNEQGDVVVSQDIAGGAMAQTGPGGLVSDPQRTQQQIVSFNRAKQLADKINLYNKGLKRGYDQVVNKSPEQYKMETRNRLNESLTNLNTSRMGQMNETLTTQLNNNDFDAARQTYSELQRRDPVLYNMSFEQMINEAEQLVEERLGGQ